MPIDMKGDWNARARRNARFFIASSEEDSEEAFSASGERDASLFFGGLEHLVHGRATVLDVGCGIGRMDEFVAPKVERLIGIDVSGEMVERARKRLGHIENLEFFEGDGETLAAFAESSIDLVFSHIVFQHVPRDVARSYFREVHRILRPEGHFVFQMPEAVPGAPADPPEDDTFEMRFYREADLRTHLLELGFEWVSVRRYPVHSPMLDFNQMRVQVRKS